MAFPMQRIFAFSVVAISMFVLAACGGGSGNSTPSIAPPASAPSSPTPLGNSVPVVVDDGPLVDGKPLGIANVAYASVKVCVPGSLTSCVTVDHVIVDTGSSGLRLLSSALRGAVALPSSTIDGQQALAECTHFAVGYTWGAVRRADVHLADESALDIPVQIIADTGLGSAPADCSASGTPMNDVSGLLANGILGIGHAIADCDRNVCAATQASATYYTCNGNECAAIALPAAQQVSNPVAAFAVDNNGSVLTLPPISADGARGVAGTLIFGIGTQTNNALGAETIQTLDPDDYTFVTNFNGHQYVGFIDSGSTFTTFADSAISQCPDASGFYCPGSTLSLTATNTGRNGAVVQVDFSVADAATLAALAPDANALDDVAVTSPGGSTIGDGTFDWGLPFFYGRSVFTAIEGRMAAGTLGPWVGYAARQHPDKTILPVPAAASGPTAAVSRT